MPYIALGIFLLLIVLVLGRAFVAANPATLARGLRWGLGIGAALLIGVLFATEQLGPALALTGGLLGVVLRGRALWQQFRATAGPRPGRVSEVETDTIRMTLDHDTGAMDGMVRRGRQQGRRLTEMSQSELVALWRECLADDEAAAKLLETYLDRAAPNWRSGDAGQQGAGQEQRKGGAAGASGAMTRKEAYEILDLKPGATEQEIKAAHRRLMLKLHPDQGGSTYLASRVNQAKDLLLKSRA
jgi:hypothetical protein